MRGRGRECKQAGTGSEFALERGGKTKKGDQLELSLEDRGRTGCCLRAVAVG